MVAERSLESKDYDGIVLVSAEGGKQIKSDVLRSAVSEALEYDPCLRTELAILPLKTIGSRLVHAPVGPIDLDYDDVRIFKNTAAKGVKRALKPV